MSLLRSILYPPTRRELALLLAFVLTLFLLLQPDVTSHLQDYRAYLPLPLSDTSSSPSSSSSPSRPNARPKSRPDWEVVPDMSEFGEEDEGEDDLGPGPGIEGAGGTGEDGAPEKEQARLDEDVLQLFSPHREPFAADVRLRWADGLPPMTKVVSHTPGFTIFENLYMLNGTAYIVTDLANSSLPDRRMMTGSGAGIYNSPAEIAAQEPTDKDMRFITPQEARDMFGEAAVRLHGNSFWTNDPAQLIAHYYHFSAELLFGIWRTYASLDPSITPLGNTRLPAPRRWIFPHLPADKWRDYASMNQYVLFATMPSVQLLFQADCADIALTAKPHLLERAIYSDRSAALRGKEYYPKQRMAALAFAHPHARNWWAPVRSNVVRFAGGDLNPHLHPHPPPGLPAPDNSVPDVPVITYVSRQNWGRRMLRPEDHDGLVAALEGLHQQYGYEVNVVNMDKLSRDEQIRLAGRTTILMGVHGNGLTSLLWMKPTPRTTVMEFFIPQGWAYDYEWTARALGMVHYGWWNDTFSTFPNIPVNNNYPDGFQGNDIPLHGPSVAAAIHRRLILDEEAEADD